MNWISTPYGMLNDFDSTQGVSQVFIKLFDPMIFYFLWVRLL